MHDRVGQQLRRQQFGTGEQFAQAVGGENSPDGAARDRHGAGVVRHAQPIFERLDLGSGQVVKLRCRQEHVASGGVG
ncbi:hypothetical protein D7231_20170 [Streptomyces klenkii]|uniref:Uncharacterized protein n=1 Tax=Streptomyces klenkii TaxID=1420899 RepID=A0A3B0BCZ2_9ACTN|nr:hypothetical protein D7231_20170 [Streptomyces klenkii]